MPFGKGKKRSRKYQTSDIFRKTLFERAYCQARGKEYSTRKGAGFT